MIQKASLAESWDGGRGDTVEVTSSYPGRLCQKALASISYSNVSGGNNQSISFFFFYFLRKDLSVFIFRLWWVFAAAHGLSSVVASRGYSLLQCTGFSLGWLLLSRSGSAAAAVHRLSCSTWLSCSEPHGIFSEQGSNWYPLHCKVGS